MSLHKTADLLAALDSAKLFSNPKMGNLPQVMAMLYSHEGIDECLKQERIHPWAGLMLYCEAYGDPHLTRSFAQAAMAMGDLAKQFAKKPAPKEWRKLLEDPERSEQGYSLDCVWFGPIAYGGDLESKRERVRASLVPAEPPPKPPEGIESVDAYLLRNGEMVHVGFEGHIRYADSKGLKTDEPDRLGWIKISSGRVHLPDKRPSRAQMTKLKRWCARHGKPFGGIEEHAAAERYYAYLFFDNSFTIPKTVDGD